jgi:hypothetical protein
MKGCKMQSEDVVRQTAMILAVRASLLWAQKNVPLRCVLRGVHSLPIVRY